MPAPATSRVRGNQELQRAFKLPPDSEQAVMNRHQDASGFVLEVACNRVVLTEWRIPYASDSQFLASVLVERVICPEMVPSATTTHQKHNLQQFGLVACTELSWLDFAVRGISSAHFAVHP